MDWYLFSSTLLTLLVIPVLYLVFDDVKDRVTTRLNRFRAYMRLGKRPGAAKIKGRES